MQWSNSLRNWFRRSWTLEARIRRVVVGVVVSVDRVVDEARRLGVVGSLEAMRALREPQPHVVGFRVRIGDEIGNWLLCGPILVVGWVVWNPKRVGDAGVELVGRVGEAHVGDAGKQDRRMVVLYRNHHPAIFRYQPGKGIL